jgi:hypothetical protein
MLARFFFFKELHLHYSDLGREPFPRACTLHRTCSCYQKVARPGMKGSKRPAHLKHQKHKQVYGIAEAFSCICCSRMFGAILNVLSYKIVTCM